MIHFDQNSDRRNSDRRKYKIVYVSDSELLYVSLGKDKEMVVINYVVSMIKKANHDNHPDSLPTRLEWIFG